MAKSSPARCIDSVNGQINFSFPAVYQGREVQDVQLTFRDGKVVDARAAKGEDFLISHARHGRRQPLPRRMRHRHQLLHQALHAQHLFDEKIGGTVHFALGAGYPETGNANQSGLHWDMVVDLRHRRLR